jgi:hypothetical protein
MTSYQEIICMKNIRINVITLLLIKILAKRATNGVYRMFDGIRCLCRTRCSSGQIRRLKDKNYLLYVDSKNHQF